MFVKVVDPSGVSSYIEPGYLQVELLANLYVSNPGGVGWYVTGQTTNSNAIAQTSVAYLDPQYSAQADAEAALVQLVDQLGQLGN